MARYLLTVALGLSVLTNPAQATTMHLVFSFTDPAWSASASFDDTTGVLSSSGFWVYDIATMTVSHGGVTWTEDEITLVTSSIIVDPVGQAAMLVGATDIPAGDILSSVIWTSDPPPRLDQALWQHITVPGGSVVGSSYYTAAVAPEPATLLLLGSGLTALGTLAWRRRR